LRTHFFWEGYFNFHVTSVCGVPEGVRRGKQGVQETARGRGIEASNSVKTVKGVGGRFHYKPSEALRKVTAAAPPVLC